MSSRRPDDETAIPLELILERLMTHQKVKLLAVEGVWNLPTLSAAPCLEATYTEHSSITSDNRENRSKSRTLQPSPVVSQRKTLLPCGW